jgi:hypothetical protein
LIRSEASSPSTGEDHPATAGRELGVLSNGPRRDGRESRPQLHTGPECGPAPRWSWQRHGPRGCRRTCAWRVPSLRQDKPRRGGSDVDNTETFRSSPGGSTPSRQRLASQPEVSLAWAEATLFVKRRQRVLKPCIWPRNHVNAGAFVLLGAGAASRGPLWARSTRSGRGLGVRQRYGMDCLGT